MGLPLLPRVAVSFVLLLRPFLLQLLYREIEGTKDLRIAGRTDPTTQCHISEEVNLHSLSWTRNFSLLYGNLRFITVFTKVLQLPSISAGAAETSCSQ